MSLKIFQFFFIVFIVASPNLIAQTFTDADDLKSAVNGAAETGGTFIVENGTYNDFEATFQVIATAENPIVIKAESIGGVTLTGESHFVFKKSAHITFEGFVFDCTGNSTLVKLEGCNNIRITRNVFELETENSVKWVFVGGYWNDYAFEFLSHDNRIDHNIFQNKTTPGHYITIDGTKNEDESVLQQSQNDRIDHNYFKNNQPRATNEKESIRIGWSEMSLSSGYTVVEFNLFEDCDGDPEIIAVKSCDNIIRHNTFLKSYGTLSLRHGNRNRVEGNYFLGGDKENGTSGSSTTYTGGIRIYGTDHVIVNNYFEGLKGTRWDAPITLTQGDAIDGESSSLSKHFRAERVTIAYNTLVNNSYGIEIGFDNNDTYEKGLVDITFANNLVTGSTNSLVRYWENQDQGDEISWINNIMYPTSDASLTSDGSTFTNEEVLVTNPNLSFDGTVWRTTDTSPTISNGIPSLIVDEDIEGQSRPDTSNPGADHFSVESTRYKSLTPTDVGPNAYGNEEPSENLYLSTVSAFSAEGGTQSVTVNSNIDWTASDDSDWITVTPEGGSNSGSIDITVSENTTFSQRNGLVTVSGGSVTRTVSISQEAGDPTSGLNLINDGTVNDPVTVTASTEQVDGVTYFNYATNTLDKDFDTRWSGEGIGAELVYDLGELYNMDLVSIATLSGKTYLYEILTSADGVNYTSVANVESNTSGTFENYEVTNQAQYIKIIGGGQTGGSLWNSITEIEFYGTAENYNDDVDGDGIPNDGDACPNTPVGEEVDANGCSESQNTSLIPADLMENCHQWKITYPTGEEDKTLCDEPNNEYFYVNDAQDAIVFYAPIRSDNGTTPNSSNIRSELRERVQDGSVDIYWTTEGSHSVYVKQAITHLPMNKPHLVATQVHGNKDDGIDDAMVLRLEGSHLFLSFNGGKLRSDVTIKTNYVLGTVHEVIFLIIDGKHYCYYSEDGNLLSAYNDGNADSYLVKADGNDYVMDRNYGDSYFKVGNYTQSNADEEGSDTDDPENYGEVLVYEFFVRHDDVTVTGVNLSPPSMDLLVGNTYQLSGSVSPVSATNNGVSYGSDNTAVASVDANGLVTAVTAGSATITVTSDEGGFTESAEIYVYEPAVVPNLALNKSVTGTGTPDGEHIVAHLVDGQTTTRWSVSDFPQTAIIDLGAVYDIERTELVAYSDRAYKYSVSISSSENGPETLLVDRSDNRSPTTENNPNINLFTPVSGRFVKLVVTGAENYSGAWVSIQEFRVFGSSDTGNDNDLDGDGVLNDVDICSNTPLGALVDANGCLLLEADNFTIESTSETCQDKNNGLLIISAQQAYNYRVTVNGTQYSMTNSSDLIIENLAPDTYEVCIVVTGQTSPYCYSVVIEEGISVSGKSVTTKNKTTVEILQGTAPFKVLVNGQERFQTMASSFDIVTEHGDVIQVITDISCEGKYSKTIEFFDQVTAYPNPTKGPFEVAVPTGVKDVVIELYNNNAQLISKKTYQVEGGKAQLNLSGYATGLYQVRVLLSKPVSLAVIKK